MKFAVLALVATTVFASYPYTEEPQDNSHDYYLDNDYVANERYKGDVRVADEVSKAIVAGNAPYYQPKPTETEEPNQYHSTPSYTQDVPISVVTEPYGYEAHKKHHQMRYNHTKTLHNNYNPTPVAAVSSASVKEFSVAAIVLGFLSMI